MFFYWDLFMGCNGIEWEFSWDFLMGQNWICLWDIRG